MALILQLGLALTTDAKAELACDTVVANGNHATAARNLRHKLKGVGCSVRLRITHRWSGSRNARHSVRRCPSRSFNPAHPLPLTPNSAPSR